MRRRPSAWPRGRHALAWLCLCAAVALPGHLGASEADDPMLRMLQSRGLVDSGRATSSADTAGGAAQLVLAAMSFLDIEYRYGGGGARDGFDCSGFTQHVFATALGLSLPRRAAEQASAPSLHAVEREALQPGDLVFFNTLRRAFSHVGLYIGDGRFVHAPRTGAQVRVESMRSSYWARRFDGARRIGPIAAAAAHAPSLTDEVFGTGSSPH